MSVKPVDSANFAKEVLSSDRPVLVDFWAPWCMPCKMLSPVVDQIAAAHPEIEVRKVNVDEAPALAQKYQIMGIPALLLFQSGEPVARKVGVQPRDSIEAMLG